MNNKSLAPKNFFLQIGILLSLYVSTIALLVFLFAATNSLFPEDVITYYPDEMLGYNESVNISQNIRFAISVLFISFPLFLILGRVYRRFVLENSEIKDNKLRKWIIYLTLFVTGLTMAVDGIILINTFLSGETLGVNFLLKILSVFVITFTVFVFCLKDLKGYFDTHPQKSKLWTIIVAGVVLLLVISGFVLIGSPAYQKNKNLDVIRVGNLHSIQYEVVSFFQQKGTLPSDLKQLEDPLSGFVPPRDPETNSDYKYSPTSKYTFEICADFKTEFMVGDATDNNNYVNEPKYRSLDTNENWQHGIGDVCFARTIDPDKYPVNKK